MAANALTIGVDQAPFTPQWRDGLSDTDDLRLRIIDRIEPGQGIVAVTGDDAGSHMLQQGEIAVYDERWPARCNILAPDCDLTPGLYCIEHQRAPGGMYAETVGHRFLSRQPVRFEIVRKVVFVSRWPRGEERWAYRELRSRSHNGARLTARVEGPFFALGLSEMLLGPIIGIYRPQLGGLN